MPADTPAPVTANDLKQALLDRYQLPEWHTETEIALGNRRLDVVALNMWAARGWRTLGFEIKVNRRDWLGELTNWDKASEWAQVVDAFYVVAPKGVIETAEVPRGWGFLERVGSRFFQRAAPESKLGQTWPREVVARFMMRVHNRANALQAAVDNRVSTDTYAIRRELAKDIEAKVRADYEREHPELDELRRKATAYDELAASLGLARTYLGEDKMRALAKLCSNKTLDALITGAVWRITHHRDDVNEILTHLTAFDTTMKETPVNGHQESGTHTG